MMTVLRDIGIGLEVVGVLAVIGALAYLKLRFYVGFLSFNKKSDIQTLFPKN